MTIGYDKSIEKAVWIHMYTLLGMTILTFAAEVLFFFILSAQGAVEASTSKYIWKYILLPTGLNAACTALAWLICRSNKLSLKKKEYAVSLLITVSAFVIAVTHATFSSVYLLFTLVIILTVFYGDKRLTATVFCVALAGRVLSAVFCIDNSVTFGDDEFSDLLLALIILCCIYILSLTIIRVENEKREMVVQSIKAWGQMRETARRDPMTELLNRTALSEFHKSGGVNGEGKIPRYFAMWDLDGFKIINDTYGHLQGDDILRYMGGLCHEGDCGMICFRYGGDEFCALIFDEDRKSAELRLRNLQEKLAQYVGSDDKKIPVSISIGVTDYHREAALEQLISKSDKAMYQAKALCKGSIVFQEK